jgi:hypothetical protein
MIIGNAISVCDLRKKSSGNGTDADAQAFITASGISGTNATAINTLVGSLKSANIWTKMKAVYPMVGGTATSCKWNLKNPVDSNAAFRLVFSGGGTFSSAGYQPNGTNAFADTFLLPSTTLSLNNTHVSFYSRTNNISGTYFDMGTVGSSSSVTNAIYLCPFITNLYYGTVNSNVESSVSNTNTIGLYIASRTSATVQKLVKNTTISSFNANSQGLSNFSINIGRWNNPGPPLGAQYYSPRQCAFASIGDGLTDAEVTAFYNAVQTFNTTLGRQV